MSEIPIPSRVEIVEATVKTLDADLRSVARDVRDLAAVVRGQGENIQIQIQQLMVAVTTAAAPRRTDWAAVLGVGIAAMVLIMAIGAAALSPMYLRINDTQSALLDTEKRLKEHTDLKMHPVSEAKIDYLEKTFNLQVDTAAKAIIALDIKLQKEGTLINDTLKEQMANNAHQVSELDTRLQREFALANEAIKNTALVLEKTTTERIETLNQLSIQRAESLIRAQDVILSRLFQLEVNEKNRDKSDLDELRQRRVQSMVCPK